MGLIASGSLSCSFGPRRQFADVIPFDHITTRVVIENHLCFAVLEDCVDSSVSGSKSVLNPCISSDKLTIAVVETRFKSGHLNSPIEIVGLRLRVRPRAACLTRRKPAGVPAISEIGGYLSLPTILVDLSGFPRTRVAN